ncbi:MAG: hypothetical protein ACTSRP_02650 [Candidatus Helarchaeota archaeon]
MNGILLCKFDENKGYVPVKIYPKRLDTEKNKQLFRDIAKNAIGFGSSITFNHFKMDDVNITSRRFNRTVEEARGGIEIFSLAVLSNENINIDNEKLEEYTNKLLNNWDDLFNILKELYDEMFIKNRNIAQPSNIETSMPLSNLSQQMNSISPINQNLTKKGKGKGKRKEKKKDKTKKEENKYSFLFKEDLIKPEKKSFFAVGANTPRNITMTIGMLLTMLIFAFNYDIVSFIIMFDFGVLLYSFINNRKTAMRISVGILSVFIIYILIGIIIFMIYGNSLLINPNFPDVLSNSHLTLLSFFSGFLVSLGLDRGKNIDKISTLIGGIFVLIDVILFIILPIIFGQF